MTNDAKVRAKGLRNRRFRVAALLLVTALAVVAARGPWTGDFWEHAAVVRELARNPVEPLHPQLRLDAPHAFYSPYALGLALAAKGSGLDSLTVLAVAGVLNLVLLLVGLRLFVRTLVGARTEEVCFYTIVLTVLWWGHDAWTYSGFLHAGTIFTVAPYPSTFALGVTLCALGLNERSGGSARWWRLLLIGVSIPMVFLTHPLTAIVLICGLSAQAITQPGHRWSRLACTLALIGGGTLVALCWPYYPVMQLLAGESTVYHASNRPLYGKVLTRLWPTLVLLPLLLSSDRFRWRRPHVMMGAALVGLYAWGGVSGHYAYGRVIAAAVLMLHIALAERLVVLESHLARGSKHARPHPWLLPLAVVAIGLLLSWRPLARTAAMALLREHRVASAYGFLAERTARDEVVLSDLMTAWPVPAFGGRIVAVRHPIAFVPDHAQRQAAVRAFFGGDATVTRSRLLEKYEVDHLLLSRERQPDWRDYVHEFRSWGVVTHTNAELVLLSRNAGE